MWEDVLDSCGPELVPVTCCWEHCNDPAGSTSSEELFRKVIACWLVNSSSVLGVGYQFACLMQFEWAPCVRFLYGVLTAPQANAGRPPYSWGFLITHSDTPQSVGLLWTSGQLVAETSTWHHTIHTSKRWAADSRLWPLDHCDLRGL